VAERKYNQNQIDALSMADTELASDLYGYLENRPMAKLGLDAYLYEYPKGEKQKLLPIETVPQDQLGANTRVTGFRSPRSSAQYDPQKDRISIGVGFSRNEQITNLIHELEHRGQKLFYEANPDYRTYEDVGSVTKDTFHAEIYKRDAETRKKLGLPPPSTYFYDPEKKKYYVRNVKKGKGRIELNKLQAAALQKRLKDNVNKFLKGPAMFYQDQPRYPSITKKKKRTGGTVNKYSQGGKVYSNQGPRKVKIT